MGGDEFFADLLAGSDAAATRALAVLAAVGRQLYAKAPYGQQQQAQVPYSPVKPLGYGGPPAAAGAPPPPIAWKEPSVPEVREPQYYAPQQAMVQPGQQPCTYQPGLQYEGNAGGGVVCLGSGKIHVSPKQQIREEQEAPLLPAIIEGGAGSDSELDRPSGAADALGPLPPPTVGLHADTEGDGVQASARLKDAAVEIAAQLEGSAVHKKMLQSLELAGTIGLTTIQLMATKAMKNAWVFKNALKTHGLQGSQVSPARVFAQLSGIKCQKFNPGGMKFFKCVLNDEGARGILPHNSVEHDAVPAIQQIDMMQQRQQQMAGGGDAPAAGTQPSFPKPARVEPMPANLQYPQYAQAPAPRLAHEPQQVPLPQQQNNNRRSQYPTDPDLSSKRPTGLEWTCIGKLKPKTAHIHGSRDLLQMLETRIREWDEKTDWTERQVTFSPDQWSSLAVRKLSFNSTLQTRGYFFQPRTPTLSGILAWGASDPGNACVGLVFQQKHGDQDKIFVGQVVKGGSAKKEGTVQAGDILKTVDGKMCPSMADLRGHILGEVGTFVALTFVREGPTGAESNYEVSLMRQVRGGRRGFLSRSRAWILTEGRPLPFCSLCRIDIANSPKDIKAHLISEQHRTAEGERARERAGLTEIEFQELKKKEYEGRESARERKRKKRETERERDQTRESGGMRGGDIGGRDKSGKKVKGPSTRNVEINKQISVCENACEDSGDLCALIDVHAAEFNDVNVVTAFRKLLQSRREGLPSGVLERALQALEAAALRTIDAFGARLVANILHIIAKARYSPNDQSLVPQLEGRAEALAGTFNAQEVANTLWAYATMGREPGAGDRKSTRLNSSHFQGSRMPSSA